MTDHPGQVWGLIQEWLDTFRYRPPSQRDLAKRLGVSNSSLTDYKYARSMPGPIFVLRLSRLLQVPYERALDAVLQDSGFRGAGLDYNQDLLDSEPEPEEMGSHERRSRSTG